MILADTSAWIEFLRDTGSRECIRIDTLLAGGVATCALAIRVDVPVLHHDADFEVLARYTPLRIDVA